MNGKILGQIKGEVVIYSKSWCPYCQAAIELLTRKNIAFKTIDVTGRKDLTDEMVQRAGGKSTVPQIFFGEKHIGGCDDLYALEERGALDKLVSA